MNRNRQVLVTGGSSEIGRAILHKLKMTGYTKVITTSKHNNVLDPDPNWVVLPKTNLTLARDLQRIFNSVKKTFSGPFTIIHSVGKFWEHKPIDLTSLEETKEMVMSHYFTLFAIAHALLPLAAKHGGGRVLAFSCNSVSHNYPEMAAFTSAKAAVECLVKCIANEWSQHGIIANAFALPTIRTSNVVEHKPHGDHDNYINPEQLADAVLNFLDSASPYINGSVVKLMKYSPTFYNDGFFKRNPSYRAAKALREK